MGKSQRDKGHSFERLVAQRIREALRYEDPNKVRRSQQARGALEPDVIVDDPLWSRLWIECQNSATPNPVKKWAQAADDIRDLGDVNFDRVPLIVWKLPGSAIIMATVHTWDLEYFTGRKYNLPLMHIAFYLDDVLCWMHDRAVAVEVGEVTST